MPQSYKINTYVAFVWKPIYFSRIGVLAMKICFRKIKKSVREDLIWLGAYFYYKSLKKDTLDMVDSIIKETDDARLHKKIEIFTRLKTRESRYVEVASAVVFTSVTQSLSWPSVANANWSASALLYSSVVLAIAAVVVGAQQQRVLPSFVDDAHLNFNEKSLQLFRERLMFRDRKNRSVVFALQCPLMMLSFSVLSFLAAMCSTIFGPLVVAIRWDDNAKTALTFGIFGLFTLLVFLYCSQYIYRLPDLELERDIV
ncbi:MAG: hypothetical protein Q9162_000280 [Coniocarpon cinnabarinum]